MIVQCALHYLKLMLTFRCTFIFVCIIVCLSACVAEMLHNTIAQRQFC